MECHFSAVSIAVYTALIHHFTCRLEARQALIYQLALGLTGENGKYNDSRAVHLYPPFFDITCSAKNYKIAPALTRINLTVPKGRKDTIQAHAEAHSESVNGFINRAILEAMERDGAARAASEGA